MSAGAASPGGQQGHELAFAGVDALAKLAALGEVTLMELAHASQLGVGEPELQAQPGQIVSGRGGASGASGQWAAKRWARVEHGRAGQEQGGQDEKRAARMGLSEGCWGHGREVSLLGQFVWTSRRRWSSRRVSPPACEQERQARQGEPRRKQALHPAVQPRPKAPGSAPPGLASVDAAPRRIPGSAAAGRGARPRLAQQGAQPVGRWAESVRS